MGEQRDVANIGQRWSGWARIIGTVIALAAIFGLGTVFYNDVWQRKVLTYLVLPTYDLGGQFFTGLIIENRGRVTLTDIQIVLSDLDASMDSDPHMPGPHEPVYLDSGGAGEREALIKMPRLSKGASLPIYILTSEKAELAEGETFFISSMETPAVASPEQGIDPKWQDVLIVLWMWTVAEAVIILRGVRVFKWAVGMAK